MLTCIWVLISLLLFWIEKKIIEILSWLNYRKVSFFLVSFFTWLNLMTMFWFCLLFLLLCSWFVLKVRRREFIDLKIVIILEFILHFVNFSFYWILWRFTTIRRFRNVFWADLTFMSLRKNEPKLILNVINDWAKRGVYMGEMYKEKLNFFVIKHCMLVGIKIWVTKHWLSYSKISIDFNLYSIVFIFITLFIVFMGVRM